METFTDNRNFIRNLTNHLSGIPMDQNYSEKDCAFYDPNCTYPYIIDVAREMEIFLSFEKCVRIIIPIIFGLIVILGLIGNLLVIFVVLCNRQMRSTTNILIVSLAFADLLFIIFCVPFTATGYALPFWPFGDLWCKVVQFVIFVSAYISIYTLVLMSLDRYLAVVHPISSLTIRTDKNTYIVVAITWFVFSLCHSPLLFQYGVHEYIYYNEERSTCINLESLEKPEISKMFFASFLVFGYLLPLSLICVLYGFMLKRLIYGVTPGGGQRTDSSRSKKRVTRMVVIVVVVFAICWLPIQVLFMLQHFGNLPTDVISAALQMTGNCLAYMNSCVNPILYAFLSDNFRKGFKKLLSCNPFKYTQLHLEGNYPKETEKTTNKRTSNSSHSTCTPLHSCSNGRRSNRSSEEAASQCGRIFESRSGTTTSQCAQTDL